MIQPVCSHSLQDQDDATQEIVVTTEELIK